jgi:hypothetical protein
LDIVLTEPVLQITGPSTLNSAVNYQESNRRMVLHLLHYIPEARGLEFDIIEDVIPIYQVKCSVRNDEEFTRVRLVPENKSLKAKKVGNRIEFTVPEVKGHQMIEIK